MPNPNKDIDFFSKNGGRPPIYETAKELQDVIEDYFQNGVSYRDVIVGPPNNKKIESIPIITITGVCLYCGFASRQSFYDYEKKEEFSYTIKRARLFIEKEYEELLQTVGGSAIIFALKQFDWQDKQEVEHSGNIVADYSVSAATEAAALKAKKEREKIDE